MKKFIAVASMVAMVLFAASCSKDNGENVGKSAEGASINIKFDPSILKKETKALDDLNGTDQDRLKLRPTAYVYIYFFDGMGNIVGTEQNLRADALTAIGGKTFDANDGINTSVSKVVLVANVPSGAAVPIGNIGGITTYDDLKNYHLTAAQLSNDMINNVSRPDFWLVGESAINWTGTDENGISQGNASLSLSPIFSRIDVTVRLDESKDGLYQMDAHTKKVIDLKSVDILYGGTYGNFTAFAPTSAELTAANKAPYYLTSGIIPEAGNTYWATWLANGMRREANQLINAGYVNTSVFSDNAMHGAYAAPNMDATTKEFTKSFYVFPNADDLNKPVIATLYGVRDVYNGGAATGEKTPVFWSIHFNGANTLATEAPVVEQGKVYTVKMALKGDYTDPTTGSPDPEDPAKDANITIEITDVAWKAVVIVPEVGFDE